MAEQSKEERKDDGGGCSYLQKGWRRPASTAHERGRHGDGSVSPREKAAKMVGGKQLCGAGGFNLIFLIIYRVATALILQITHKFSKEVENL